MNDDEQDLLRRARAGEREAFAELVRRHQARVLGLCLSLLCDPVEAEEAAQAAFVKAFRALKDFRGGSSFSTWMHRIAANACLDALRARTRRKTESLDELVEREGEAFQRLLEEPRGASPEDAELVRRALAALPEDYRAVLVLREQEGLSYEEIAETLDCSLDAVKARLRRARRELEEKLRHFFGPPASKG